MCWQKRFVPAFLGFWGLLLITGYECTVCIMMVHIARSDEDIPDFLGFHCFVNATKDVPEYWTFSSTQYLYCAYYVGLFSTQLLGGYFASRYSSKLVSGVCFLVNSVLLIVLPTAITVNVVLVYVIRIAQGLLDGCFYPTINGVISAWAPTSEKSRMLAFTNAGIFISPAVSFAVSGICACVVSWSSSLYIYGGCGLIWSIIWLICVYDTPSQHSGLGLKEKLLFEREGAGAQQGSYEIAKTIPWRKIFSSSAMWALLVCSFCFNWMFSVASLGLPQYFKIAFTTNIAEIGLEVALPAVCTTIMTITGGVLIDTMIKFQIVSTTVGRKIAQCLGFGVQGCCFIGLRYLEKQGITLIVLCVGLAFNGLCVSGYQVNPLDLAPQFTGVLIGFSRLGTLGGGICSLLSGLLVPKEIEVWQDIFTISGSLLIAGAVFYGVFASGERQNWNEDPEGTFLINHGTKEERQAKLTMHSATSRYF